MERGGKLSASSTSSYQLNNCQDRQRKICLPYRYLISFKLFHLRQLTSTLMHELVCYTQTAICHYIKQVSL